MNVHCEKIKQIYKQYGSIRNLIYYNKQACLLSNFLTKETYFKNDLLSESVNGMHNKAYENKYARAL